MCNHKYTCSSVKDRDARVVMICKHKRAEKVQEKLDKQENSKYKKTAKNTRWGFSPSFPCVNTKLF